MQQTGFVRAKRGYKPLKGVPLSEIRLKAHDLPESLNVKLETHSSHSKDPTDPLFEKEWFLVSISDMTS